MVSCFHGFAARLRLAAGLAACALSFYNDRASATLIVDDTFTGANNTGLIGRLAAPIDVPAAIYAGNGNVSLVGGITGGTPYEADIQSNAARLGADAGLALNLGIATPSQVQLSITFNISGNTDTQAVNAHRGAGLGFFSSVAIGSGGSFHGFNNFTGLVVDRAGSVRLIVAGANSGIATTVGGFDPSISHTLSYIVDTTSGAGSIFSILLDGSSVALSAPVDTFTLARTIMGGFYNSDGAATSVAGFDDFIVVAVPELSSLASVTAALAVISLHYLLVLRRANKQPQPIVVRPSAA